MISNSVWSAVWSPDHAFFGERAGHYQLLRTSSVLTATSTCSCAQTSYKLGEASPCNLAANSEVLVSEHMVHHRGVLDAFDSGLEMRIVYFLVISLRFSVFIFFT